MGLLIDSTLLIHAERSRLTADRFIAEIIDRWGDVELSISAMSAAELLHGVWRAEHPARRARREGFVDGLLAAVPVLAVTLPIARVFAEIDARLRAAGNKLPTSDLLIGCTALAHGDEVATGNVRHFRRIPGLTVYEWK